jgi:hypothetical protein
MVATLSFTLPLGGSKPRNEASGRGIHQPSFARHRGTSRRKWTSQISNFISNLKSAPNTTRPRATASGGEGEVVEPQGQPVRDYLTAWRVVTHEEASRSICAPAARVTAVTSAAKPCGASTTGNASACAARLGLGDCTYCARGSNAYDAQKLSQSTWGSS